MKKKDLNKFNGLSAVEFPIALKTFEEFNLACTACETYVTITQGIFARLRPRLAYFKQSKGPRGRALTEDFPDLGLLRGDRLEPFHGMERLELFDKQAKPFQALFWRRSCETAVRHRGTLWSAETGLTADQALVPDWLHGLSLGGVQFWTSQVWGRLLESNVFGTAASTVQVTKELFVNEMKTRLWS